MITKKLVQPSFNCIRIADFLNFLPLSADIQTGKVRHEKRFVTSFLHGVIYFASWLKVLQIFYALIVLLVHFTPESFPVVILTALWLSLSATAAFWSHELFHRGIGETVILFNELNFPNPDGHSRSEGSRLFTGVGQIKVVRLAKTLLSLSLQELLCVMTPFAVKMFVPLYVLLLLIFPHWTIFSTSLVYGVGGWTWKTGLLIAFEVVTAFSTESNILFLFFFQLALQVTVVVGIQVDVNAQK